MANYIATTEQFTATANAIRAKTGSSGSLEWDANTGYADDIAAIETGGVDMVTVDISRLNYTEEWFVPSNATVAEGSYIIAPANSIIARIATDRVYDTSGDVVTLLTTDLMTYGYYIDVFNVGNSGGGIRSDTHSGGGGSVN